MKNICFTGHREIRDIKKITNYLLCTIDDLIQKGATNFFAGGAIGFDTLAAEAVILLRKKYPYIKLFLILPCCGTEQTLYRTLNQKKEYKRILSEADDVEFISEHYFDGCMKQRNSRLIELADYCICYYNNKKSAGGTAQTVRMTQKKNIPVINLFTLSF